MILLQREEKGFATVAESMIKIEKNFTLDFPFHHFSLLLYDMANGLKLQEIRERGLVGRGLTILYMYFSPAEETTGGLHLNIKRVEKSN